MFAVWDTGNAVTLFKRRPIANDPKNGQEWIVFNKIVAHEIKICSICFGDGIDENGNIFHRLFSVGVDRRVFEYNLYDAARKDPLKVERHFKVEQEALPSCCLWYPSREGLLLTTNDHYKMKLWNPSAQSSRKTCLGPTYGGKITKMKKLQVANQEEPYLIYSTPEKVVGLIKTPLDGNPNKTMGLVAHPGKITDFAASSDGRFLFTCGGDDLSVKMWAIDVSPIEQAIQMGGEDEKPFIKLIEGGEHG